MIDINQQKHILLQRRPKFPSENFQFAQKD